MTPELFLVYPNHPPLTLVPRLGHPMSAPTLALAIVQSFGDLEAGIVREEVARFKIYQYLPPFYFWFLQYYQSWSKLVLEELDWQNNLSAGNRETWQSSWEFCNEQIRESAVPFYSHRVQITVYIYPSFQLHCPVYKTPSPIHTVMFPKFQSLGSWLLPNSGAIF